MNRRPRRPRIQRPPVDVELGGIEMHSRDYPPSSRTNPELPTDTNDPMINHDDDDEDDDIYEDDTESEPIEYGPVDDANSELRRGPVLPLPPKEHVATNSVKIEDDERCPVCFELLNDDDINDDIAIAKPCNHKFHGACLDPALNRTRNTCPLCRDEVTKIEIIPPLTAGGGHSLLDTLVGLAKTIDSDVLKETLQNYFEFLYITPADYKNIVELFKNIDSDSNLERLIIILARIFGFRYRENNKKYKSDSILDKVFGTDAERINNILQNCYPGNDLTVTKKQFKLIKSIKNVLGDTLSKYFQNSNKKQTIKKLITSLELARITLNDLFKNKKRLFKIKKL